MALRNQPYLPLYVQDFLTDEKLLMCSASSIGIYIKLMCVMHKSESYGSIYLKEKYKQNKSNIYEMFAEMVSKLVWFDKVETKEALIDLVDNGVLIMDSDRIYQKRMVKDGELSEKRAKAGSEGGKNVKNSHTRKLYNERGYIYLLQDVDESDVFKVGISKNPDRRLIQISNKTGKKMEIILADECENMGIVEDNILNELAQNRSGEWIFGIKKDEIINVIKKHNKSIIKAKQKQNTEYEYENESENVNEDNLEKESPKEKTLKPGRSKGQFIPPSLEDFTKYFIENGFSQELAKRAWTGYQEANWHDSTGKKILNWKQKCQNVWFREENKTLALKQNQHEVSKSITSKDAVTKARQLAAEHNKNNLILQKQAENLAV